MASSDTNGNELSCHYTNGVGYNCTYDTNGNELSYRHTDGTGNAYAYTYNTNGNVLSCRYTDGTGLRLRSNTWHLPT